MIIIDQLLICYLPTNKQINKPFEKGLIITRMSSAVYYHVMMMWQSFNDKNSSTVGLLVIKNNQINKQTNNWKTNQHQTNRKQTNTEIQIWWSYDYHAITKVWSSVDHLNIIKWSSDGHLMIMIDQRLICYRSTNKETNKQQTNLILMIMWYSSIGKNLIYHLLIFY